MVRPFMRSTLRVSLSDLTDLTRSSAFGAKIPMPCLFLYARDSYVGED